MKINIGIEYPSSFEETTKARKTRNCNELVFSKGVLEIVYKIKNKGEESNVRN